MFVALRRFPESTEQIFHLDKFLERERPLQIVLPVDAAGLRLAADNTFGELDVRALLAVFGVPRLDHAGTGWGGGRTAIYRAPGREAVAIAPDWDTELDAQQWSDAVALYVNEAFDADVPGRRWRLPAPRRPAGASRASASRSPAPCSSSPATAAAPRRWRARSFPPPDSLRPWASPRRPPPRTTSSCSASTWGPASAAPTRIVDVTARWADAGTEVTQFNAPISIRFANPSGAPVIPVTSEDGASWRNLRRPHRATSPASSRATGSRS
ncbi:MAG: hypothetical protein H0T13_02150, partial [Actinobacteria bacterium]|nr:hypothetical protein [Actinomycetota bacterium]